MLLRTGYLEDKIPTTWLNTNEVRAYQELGDWLAVSIVGTDSTATAQGVVLNTTKDWLAYEEVTDWDKVPEIVQKLFPLSSSKEPGEKTTRLPSFFLSTSPAATAVASPCDAASSSVAPFLLPLLPPPSPSSSPLPLSLSSRRRHHHPTRSLSTPAISALPTPSRLSPSSRRLPPPPPPPRVPLPSAVVAPSVAA